MIANARNIGEHLATSPLIGQLLDVFKAKLQRPIEDGSSNVSMLLTNGPIASNRLLLGAFLPRFDGVMEIDLDDRERELAHSVARALLAIVEWPRSRFPGYPISFCLPHIDPRAPQVTKDDLLSESFPWWMEIRFGFGYAMRAVGPLNEWQGLGLDQDGETLQGMVTSWGQSVMDSTAGRRFIDIHASMGEDDWASARKALHDFQLAVCEEKLGAFESTNLARRLQFRRDRLDEAKAAASGRVGEYYAGFEALDRLVEHHSAIIGQVADGRGIPFLESLDEEVWDESDAGSMTLSASLRTTDPFGFKPRSVFRVDDDGTERLIYVTRMTASLDGLFPGGNGTAGIDFGAEVLSDF